MKIKDTKLTTKMQINHNRGRKLKNVNPTMSKLSITLHQYWSPIKFIGFLTTVNQ